MSAEECRNHYSNDRNEMFFLNFSCLFAFRAKSWPWQISGPRVIAENNKSLLFARWHLARAISSYLIIVICLVRQNLQYFRSVL